MKVVNVVLVIPAGDELAVQDVNRMLEGAGQGVGVLEPLDTGEAGGTALGLAVYACAYRNLSRDAVLMAVREAPWEDAESVTLVLDDGQLGYRVCHTAGELRRGGR